MEKVTFSPAAQCQGPLHLSGQEISVTASVVSHAGVTFMIDGEERNGTCTEVGPCPGEVRYDFLVYALFLQVLH